MISARWVPRDKVGQVRLATLAFGLLLTSSPLARLSDGAQNGGVTMLSAFALLLLLVVLIATAALRRQISIWEGPATAVLSILVGIGLDNPLSVIGVCVGVIVSQSMYGNLVSELLRVAAFALVLPVVVSLSAASAAGQSGFSAASLALIPPLPLFAILMHLLKATLEAQDGARERASFMARLTADLLAAGSTEQASRIFAQLPNDLVRISPGLVAIALEKVRGRRELEVRHSLGVPGSDLPPRLPADLIAGLPWSRTDGPHEVKAIGSRMAEFGFPNMRWYCHGVAGRSATAPTDMVLFGIPRGLSDRLTGRPAPRTVDLVSMLTAVVEYRHSTYSYLREQEELLAAADRDDVTGLLKRAALQAELDRLLADRTRPVSVVMIGFDGLSALAAEGGFATASMAVSRLARRLIQVVGDTGGACKFSDNRFAFAVVAEVEEVDRLVETLRTRLAEQVVTSDRTVWLSISIGTARSAPGTTPWALVEQAALALRLDQAQAVRPLLRTA